MNSYPEYHKHVGILHLQAVGHNLECHLQLAQVFFLTYIYFLKLKLKFNRFKIKLTLNWWQYEKYNNREKKNYDKNHFFFSKYCNSVTFAMVTPGTFPFNILTVRAPAAVVERNFTSVQWWIRQTTRRPSRRSGKVEIVNADL